MLTPSSSALASGRQTFGGRQQNDSDWLLKVCSNQKTASTLLLWNSPSAPKWRHFGFFRWHLTLEKCGKTTQTDLPSSTSCRINKHLWNEVYMSDGQLHPTCLDRYGKLHRHHSNIYDLRFNLDLSWMKNTHFIPWPLHTVTHPVFNTLFGTPTAKFMVE